MKIRAVVILVGLAISFALPAFAQEKEEANPVKSASFLKSSVVGVADMRIGTVNGAYLRTHSDEHLSRLERDW
jgi:hypothetical protein